MKCHTSGIKTMLVFLFKITALDFFLNPDVHIKFHQGKGNMTFLLHKVEVEFSNKSQRNISLEN